MRRFDWFVPALLAGCAVPSFTTSDDADADETDVGVDTETDVADDTEAVDTPDDTFEPPDETEDTDDEPVDTDDPVAPLNCHPYDPMSYTGWERRYWVKFPNMASCSASSMGSCGLEVHTPEGNTPFPLERPNWTVNTGYQVKQQVSRSGNNDYTQNTWTVCDPSGVSPRGAYEYGYRFFANGNTLKAVIANQSKPQRYLAEEGQLTGALPPTWEQNDLKYTLQVPAANIIRGCPQTATTTRTLDVTYVVFGEETIDIPVLGGQVEAVRVNVQLEQRQGEITRDGGFQCLIGGLYADVFSQAFGQAFGSLFGFDASTGTFVTASIDRWYVRGVGLVRETAVDFVTRELLYEKELRACSNLPGC